MAVKETQLSKKCVKATPAGWVAERIENSARSGTADLVLSKDNRSCWIELKCANKPKKTDTAIDCSHIRLGQIQWHRIMRRAGCATFCLVQVGAGASAEYFLFPSTVMSELKDGLSYHGYHGVSFIGSRSLSKVLTLATEVVLNDTH